MKPTPKQPRSPRQVSIRAAIAFLSKEWKNVSPVDRATWTTLYHDLRNMQFAAYRRYNMKRWQHFDKPTMAWPPALTGGSASGNHMTADGATRHVRLHYWYTGSLNQQWAILVYRGASPSFTPGVENAIAFFPCIGISDVVWDDTPLPAGNYYYRGQRISTSGKYWNYFPELPATVT